MNHSNKDRKSSAESEEGRLRLKENTLSSDTYPTPSGTARVPRVGECADQRHVWPLYLREEPDALKSARPGPSGEYHVSGIPTGIANRQSISQVEANHEPRHASKPHPQENTANRLTGKKMLREIAENWRSAATPTDVEYKEVNEATKSN